MVYCVLCQRHLGSSWCACIGLGTYSLKKCKLKTRVRLSALHARACVICAPKCNMRAGVHKAGNKCKQLQLFNNFFEQERE
jgi:hypothetical protein